MINLDDHRPDPTLALSEEHYREFRHLCDTFGRKGGAMVITQTPRGTSDGLLTDLVRTELRGVEPELARRTVEGALRNTRACSLGNRQDGHAGKSAGGIAAANRYLAKAVRSELADLRAAEAAAIAKMRTEQVVQVRMAEKRMSAVEQGTAGRARKRGSSWDDIAADLGLDTACEAQGV